MRILVIEDHPPTLDLLERSLAEAGHETVTAARVDAALRAAAQPGIELAIVDVMLPDGSGFDLCRALRARGFAAPILFLTARGEGEDRIEGLDAGGDDYLRKPFAIAELRARVRALGRRGALGPRPRVAGGDVVIDFGARRLMRAGADVPLTSREWAVLDVLATARGALVAREDVLAAAWPNAGPGASDSMDVIVSRLRRKLGDGVVRIRTVRGQGLVLEAPE